MHAEGGRHRADVVLEDGGPYRHLDRYHHHEQYHHHYNNAIGGLDRPLEAVLPANLAVLPDCNGGQADQSHLL